MEIGKLTYELNKWQFDIKFAVRDYNRLGIYPHISIWMVNFHTFPPEGEIIQPKHYHGIHFVIKFPWPHQWSAFQTKSLAELFKFDKGIPQWIPAWVLMSDWRKHQPRMPRKFLVAILTKRFIIPTQIKFF